MEQGDRTIVFRALEGREAEAREILQHVFQALAEKGYDPIDQLVGYLLSGDPAYITSHNNARTLIKRLERDELLEVLLRYYLSK